MASFKDYYSLTKPGVLYGNALTAVAGFLFGSQNGINWQLFFAVLMGSSLMIASACVINNYLDQDIDSKMERTQKRAIVSGKVPGIHAVLLSIVLGLTGLGVLLLLTNTLVVMVGILGYIDYVLLYGMLSKRLSWHGTLVGSISGAAPILAGYVGATGQIDSNAILLFMILFFWQMPEFYSISIYRKKEYASAKIPVVSVVKGIEHTKKLIVYYTIAFVATTLLLYVLGDAGFSYLFAMATAGAYWLYLSYLGIKTKEDKKWARKMFSFSLIILLLFCFMISTNMILP